MYTPPGSTPRDREELLENARAMAGYTLGEIAAALAVDVPKNLKTNKGWVGQLIESALGSDAGNAQAPDFTSLGVELKTLPVDEDGKPFESTYVTMVRLTDVEEVSFGESAVFHKLESVLWIPVLAVKDLEIGERQVGRAVLWEPSDDEWRVIKRDWELHMETIREGFVEAITGRDGDALQIRPKAPDAKARRWTVDEHGNEVMTNPRGFYLRPQFTKQILLNALQRGD